MANRRGNSDKTLLMGTKITADGDSSHEIKRHLLLGRKAKTNLDSILKSRDFANKGSYSQSYGFSSSHYGCELDHKEGWLPMLSNCGASEDSREFLGQHGNQTSQSWKKSTLNIHWKDWCWSRSSNTLATWCDESTHWKTPGCWERLRVKEESIRGWDG